MPNELLHCKQSAWCVSSVVNYVKKARPLVEVGAHAMWAAGPSNPQVLMQATDRRPLPRLSRTPQGHNWSNDAHMSHNTQHSTAQHSTAQHSRDGCVEAGLYQPRLHWSQYSRETGIFVGKGSRPPDAWIDRQQSLCCSSVFVEDYPSPKQITWYYAQMN